MGRIFSILEWFKLWGRIYHAKVACFFFLFNFYEEKRIVKNNNNNNNEQKKQSLLSRVK